jgi:hypothetical protein
MVTRPDETIPPDIEIETGDLDLPPEDGDDDDE